MPRSGGPDRARQRPRGVQEPAANHLNTCPESRADRTTAPASSEKYDMNLPLWNTLEPVVTLVSPGDDRPADAISACGWHTPPGVGQRWGAGSVSASGWHTPELGGDGPRSSAAPA